MKKKKLQSRCDKLELRIKHIQLQKELEEMTRVLPVGFLYNKGERTNVRTNASAKSKN